jgi:23S rRNA pseudouridine2605 synthase
MEERLQKILSQWGIASRRQAEQMIQAGRVKVNGATGHLGQKADPTLDRIEVDGQPLGRDRRPQPIYLLLHKPAGVVTTCTDPWGRPTILDLLPPNQASNQGLHPVGRLDFDSTGALLVTNDGTLTYLLTHPRHHVPKTYRVWVVGQPPESVLQTWRRGIVLDGRRTLPAQVRVIAEQEDPQPQTCLEVVLMEGRNRQIRRTAERLGYPVRRLHRTAIGEIKLQPAHEPELPPGQYRPLRPPERRFIQQILNQGAAPNAVPVNI